MKKQEVIDLIVEMSATNPEMTKSVVGFAIVNAANECVNQPIDVNQTKSNFEDGLFIIEQIKICEDEMQTTEDSQMLHDMSRQRNKFIESLRKILADV